MDELDNFKVPFVKVKPPSVKVIKDCTSRTLAVLAPLFILKEVNAVVDVPVMVLLVAPPKVTCPVPTV